MKGKKYIILNIIVLIIIAGLSIILLFNKNKTESNNKTNVIDEKETTTLIMFYKENGEEIGTGYLDENGLAVIVESKQTTTFIECSLYDDTGDDYDYEDIYTFGYYSDNSIVDASHKFTYKYKQYHVADENGLSIEYVNEKVKLDTGNKYVEIKEFNTTEVYNPDNEMFNSLDEYLNILNKHYDKCENKMIK